MDKSERDKLWRAAHAEQIKERRKLWESANAEHLKEYHRQWRAANPERRKQRYAANAEQEKEKSKTWRDENPEQVKTTMKQWRQANADRYSQYNKQWQAENAETVKRKKKEYRAQNPDKTAVAHRLRRARKQHAEGHHNAADVVALWLKQGRKCAVKGCAYPISDVRGHKDMYHVDHVIPFAAKSGPKGTNWPDNLQILCKFHNMQKHNHDPYEWAQKNGRLF